MTTAGVTRGDVEALLAWICGGRVGPQPKPGEAVAVVRFRDVDCGDAWRTLAPPSQRAYRRLRLIEKRARSAGGRLTDTDCEWMAGDKGEEAEDRAERLRLMYRERPRPTVSPEWRAAMAGVVSRWNASSEISAETDDREAAYDDGFVASEGR